MFDVALAEEIWTAKYRFKTSDGTGELNFAETAARVAMAIAAVEPARTYAAYGGAVPRLCRDASLPPGRTDPRRRRHRALGHLVQLLRHGAIPRSLDGIFAH